MKIGQTYFSSREDVLNKNCKKKKKKINIYVNIKINIYLRPQPLGLKDNIRDLPIWLLSENRRCVRLLSFWTRNVHYEIFSNSCSKYEREGDDNLSRHYNFAWSCHGFGYTKLWYS